MYCNSNSFSLVDTCHDGLDAPVWVIAIVAISNPLVVREELYCWNGWIGGEHTAILETVSFQRYWWIDTVVAEMPGDIIAFPKDIIG